MCSAESAIEVAFQGGPHAGARTVEKDTLVALAHVKRVAYLARPAAGHVAHGDHHTLRVGQLFNCLHDHVEGLSPEQRSVGKCAPVARVGAPVAAEAVIRSTEAI